MITEVAKRLASRRAARQLPFLKLLAVAQVALLAGRHLQHLDADERRRLATLLRRGRSTTAKERRELRELVGKLDLKAFLHAAADELSPVPLGSKRSRERNAKRG
jgi:hypothetical protein